MFSNNFFETRKYIKTVEKKFGRKKKFWTPLSEKTGARKEKKRKQF